MSSSDQVPSFYSYSPTEMEGLNSLGNPGEEVTPDNGPQGSQFMYLQIRTEGGLPLAPTLFTRGYCRYGGNARKGCGSAR